MKKDPETKEQAIRRVAKEIQDILVANKMSMVPSISIGLNENRVEPVIDVPKFEVPGPVGVIVTPEQVMEHAKENNPMFKADFMQD